MKKSLAQFCHKYRRVLLFALLLVIICLLFFVADLLFTNPNQKEGNIFVLIIGLPISLYIGKKIRKGKRIN